MDGFLDDSAREAMVLNALSDKSSGFYQGLVKVLLNCEAADRHSRLSQPFVTLPFFLDEVETAALEAQFNVVIKVKGSILRARASPRVAGLFFLVDSALLEHAGGCGRSVLLVDGDLVTTAACGIESRIVERSGATPRLATGYFLEDDALKRFGTVRSGAINAAADVLMREQTFGGGDHYWPRVRDDGPIVDSIVVNHLKTPVGLRQLAWLAYKRQAVLYGAIPFQVEMLTQDTGRLNCFPGFFYVDKEADVITLVPESDATMSISHPYSALMGIVQSNSVTVGGVEFLCEKYCSVRGILYYTLHRVDVAFDAPEVLRTNYFDASCLGVTEISYPEVKLSSEGIPVGWTRGKVRILTARCEKVMSRVATSTNAVVTPAEVFTALMDYNNSVVASLDTVMSVDRMSVDNENKAALAIALHVNWTRDLARGTFNVLMQAIRVRHEAKNANLVKLAMLALSAWWGRPNVSSEIKYGELPISKVVDWCGNDFSVVMQDADPWIEMVEEVGRKAESTDKQYPWFPSVAVGDTWYSGLMQRVYGVVGRPVQKAVVKKPISRPFRRSIDYITEAKPVVALSLVDETEIRVDRPLRELTDIKQALARKMHADQGAYGEVVPGRYLLVRHQVETGVNDSIPVVAVDPISSIRDDVLMCNGGPFDRNMVATGYRIAEVDIDKVTEGNFSVNDAKRLIPAARWVRQPKVDAGVEGKRVSSQAALMGALFKRNIGVPANRGAVDLDLTPKLVVEKVIQVCYRDDWREIVNKHLNTGMWEPNAADIDDFVAVLDETKVKKLLDEFFLEGHVDLQRWMLMAKGKIKSSREPGADAKIDHSQTIMYLENSSTNAMYSAMTRRFKECLDECLRPEVCLNGQRSDSEQEEWYNSLDSVRRSFPITHSYSADVKCYDRSQEHTGLGIDLEWYRVHGLGPERLEIWSQTHGTKRAIAMMFGVILTMVLGGVSGLWKTLLRNGLINLAAIVVSTGITRRDVVMIDIKGDDSDCEFSRPIEVESTIERMSLTFNFSAKFFTNNVRYMCKQFRIKLNGRWIFVSDPWARVQSLCTPLWIGNKEDNLEERWISLCADLRHYENGLAVDAVAEAAQQYYGTERPLYGFARGLAAIKADRGMYFNFFDPPVKID